MNLSQDNEDAAVTEATEEKKDSGAGDLINLGASALQGLLGLLGAKIDIIRSLLTNKVLTQKHVLSWRPYSGFIRTYMSTSAGRWSSG